MRHLFRLTLQGVLMLAAVGAGGQEAAKAPEPKDILLKALAVYAGAKTYQGNWTYTQQQGASAVRMAAEIRAKNPSKLLFRLAPAPGQKPPPNTDPIPELLVVLDGKTAWFQNATEKVYYKVDLPKNWQGSPLMFFPQIPAATPVQRGADMASDGRTCLVLQAETPDGSATRMEVDAQTHRIRRIVSEKTVATMKIVSTITVEKEVFDADLPDSGFVFKAAKGAKELPAPPEAGAIFGVPSTQKPDR